MLWGFQSNPPEVIENILIITDLGELQFQYVRGCNDALY
jgi:hypothetical protein